MGDPSSIGSEARLAEIKAKLRRYKRNPALEIETSGSTWQRLSYSELDPSRRQIRLLKILSHAVDNNGDRYIDCSLHTVSLNDHVQYDALSYVWGDSDPESCLPLRVNGGWCLVTMNLWLALKASFAEQWTPEYLWADALCINQEDKSERSSQIEIMGSIYRQARIVHIWLIDKDHIALCEDAKTTEALGLLRSIYTVLGGLFTRHWWHRIWVIQESIVASVPLVHYGKENIRFRDLMEAMYLILEDFSRANISQDAEDHRLNSFGSSILAAVAVFDSEDLQDEMQSSWETVLGAIEYNTHKAASDPRDRIYALIGYLPASIGIVPDYNASTEEVYRSSTLKLMQWGRSLSLLHSTPSRQTTGTRTWAPDFREHLQWMHTPENQPTVRELPFFCLESSDHELRVHSLIINVVKKYSSRFPGEAPRPGLDMDAITRLRGNINECHSLVHAVQGPHMDNDPSAVDCFWRTLTRDSMFLSFEEQPTSATTNPYNAYDFKTSSIEAWLSDPSRSLDFETTRRLRMSLATGAGGKVFFVTDSKRMGLTSGSVSQGDVIAILAGSDLPMILRTVDRNQANRYEVVGPCYLDGVMNGEAVSHIIPTNETGTALDYGFEEILLI